jgi:hypothetical protein
VVPEALDAQTPDTEKPAAVRIALPSFFAEKEERFLEPIADGKTGSAAAPGALLTEARRDRA